MTDAGAPCAIVLRLDPPDHTGWAVAATRALLAAGWQVRQDAPDNGGRTGPTLPALVVSAADRAESANEAVWARGAARVAVIDGDSCPVGFDDHVPVTAGPACFAAIVQRWQPVPLSVATQRLVDVFGADAISPMLDSLADMLNVALRGLDDPDAVAVAHRVAGTAGTLGFAELSRGWLAISEGDWSDTLSLRRTTRLAIGAIRRRGTGSSAPKQVPDTFV